MKTLRLLIAAAVVVLIAGRASAELIVFKGALKQSGLGQGFSRNFNSKYYLIVDYDTANVAQIQYTTVNKSKIYSAIIETNLHFIQIETPKGGTAEAIVHSPNSCDLGEGLTSDGVFLEGSDSQLLVNAGSMISFPKVMSGGGNSVSESSGSPIFVKSTLLVSFDATQTILSNQAGEKLDEAMTDITTMLDGEGYTRQSEKSNVAGAPLKVMP